MKELTGILLMVLAVPAAAADQPFAQVREMTVVTGPAKASVPLEARQAARVVTVTDLHWAAISGDLAEVRRLLDEGASVTATETLWGGETPLHWAAIASNPAAIREFLDAGAAIEAQDHDGETAVREALRSEDSNFLTLQALLVAGADADAVSNDGHSALHESVWLSTEYSGEAVRLLRMFGANPQLADQQFGATPLHYATLQPWEQFSGYWLLNAAIDPNGRVADANAQDIGGWTPLHWLVATGVSAKDLRVARWLVRNGADPYQEDLTGMNVIEWAEHEGEHELASEIRAVAAEASSQ